MEFSKVKEIIEKVRQIYKYNDEYNSIVNVSVIAVFTEEPNKEINLKHIEFSCYDTLLVSENAITYIPEHGRNKVILRYSGWEELLAL